jgi:hypothetical protein
VEYVLIADKASKEDEAEVKQKITGYLKCCLQSQTSKMILWQDLELLKTQLNL